MEKVVQALPTADFYVFEELPYIQPKDPYLRSRIRSLQVETSLATLLHMRKPGRIFSTTNEVIDSFFGFSFGQERANMYHRLDKLLLPRSQLSAPSDNYEPTSLHFAYATEDQLAMWHDDIEDKAIREQMCMAVLLAISVVSIKTK